MRPRSQRRNCQYVSNNPNKSKTTAAATPQSSTRWPANLAAMPAASAKPMLNAPMGPKLRSMVIFQSMFRSMQYSSIPRVGNSTNIPG
jgi:hypothetical protein